MIQVSLPELFVLTNDLLLSGKSIKPLITTSVVNVLARIEAQHVKLTHVFTLFTLKKFKAMSAGLAKFLPKYLVFQFLMSLEVTS